MRIIYNYTFNVTKLIKREEMIPLLLDRAIAMRAFSPK